MRFRNRVDGGQRLAVRLAPFKGPGVVVLGLPRGGVPVAYEVAKALGAPLDVIVVRKLGVPSQPELAMGAIGEDGVVVINHEVVRLTGATDRDIAAVEAPERIELDRRAQRFRGDRPHQDLRGRTAIIVDDGIATGSTALAACQVARRQGAARVILAVPVAPDDFDPSAHHEIDEFVCLQAPAGFYAVGQWYEDFSATSDDEVVTLLERAGTWDRTENDGPTRDEEVDIAAGPVRLAGHLTMPARARGVVLFAHGSGSSRHSPRNQFVASVLQEAGIGTLLFDLLTMPEERDRANVFDIELLGGRLLDVTRWLRSQPHFAEMPLGYFGASTGAAAALWAAADASAGVTAVVSRGGRPDLAGERLALVRAPTLLIVGGFDDVVVELNRQAEALLQSECELAIVPGATHLFEEPGTLEAAAGLARDWFVRHL